MPMRIIIYLSFTLLTFVSCNLVEDANESELIFHSSSKEDFAKIINTSDFKPDKDISTDRSLLNLDYPIEIYLYENNKWYYDLPNLGDGHGTWIFKDGIIKLFAKRKLFDMHIEVLSRNQNNTEFAVKFSDRFGPQYLEVERTIR